MARPDTVRRVHTAVLTLAQQRGVEALTMEGIAAAAGVGKQTLYRSWPSLHAVVFDALAAESVSAGGDTEFSVVEMLEAAGAEISTEPRNTLLRTLAAAVQSDETVAREFHRRLLAPQTAQIQRFVAAAGADDPVQTAELLLAPIVYRWFLRLPPMTGAEVRAHVHRVLPPGV